ncbi:type VI secretion system tip protein VgrG [Escherichia coli]|uniref:type VI secretion system Vgr family protein n=1 Tax=Escherichia coli TaxID=562 RepID=UPI001801D5E8|nr:type VI secretion system tip protein TssI/VgrG [Escherichia coli]EFD5161004.1 type VI secretion system tip protein VgrG [Escherichia coli]EFF0595711.1 type VI secretion system tip protein VgrG [Escherichia coli]EGJ5232838.1 type VI secretion system tip protein VgrG [Escherichia coli]EGN3554049.1 type VI secretion system tip protein VgrG [Escherichia coli]EHC2723594.1 type VI secretion system tip protein VgrG [Escherichia coli]
MTKIFSKPIFESINKSFNTYSPVSDDYYKHQDKHFIRLHGCGLSLFPLEIQGGESISEVYAYEIKCLSKDNYHSLDKLHGTRLSCEIAEQYNSWPSRFIHGVVTKVIYNCDNSMQHTCIIVLQPEITELATGKRTRVWTNIKPSDIVKTILNDCSFESPEVSLYKQEELLEYKIQYQESDLEFINRVLSDAGIYYFFVHNKNKHIMKLADAPASHPESSYCKLEHLPSENIMESNPGYISEWSVTENLKCPSVTLFGYNESNVSEITIKSESKVADVKSSKGVYEDIIPDGKRELIKKRSEALMASYDSELKIWSGKTNSWWLSCGERFSLAGKDYRITSLYLHAVNNDIHDAIKCAGACYCDLYASDNKSPLNVTGEFNYPVIPGVLLARVVGPDSEEYYTDEYGRVKIRFLWGEKSTSGTDKTSCWVRVSQVWAGEGFGSQFIPRIGSEVLVSFIQGNPDYPVIVGSVYNGQNKPPFSLSENNCRSGFFTRSVKNGKKGEGHQLVFDDKENEEKAILTSSGDCLLTVKKDMICNINHSMSLTVGEGRNYEIKKGNDKLILKEGDLHNDVHGNIDIKVLDGNYNLRVTGGSGSFITDKNLTLESTQSIKLKVGANEIMISASGINIKAAKVSIEGQVSAEVKAATLKLEGQAISEVKGTMLTLQGSAMAQIKGGIVNIG